MKYAIRGGHSLDIRGAHGIVDEVTEDRKITAKVIEYLKQSGNDVLDVTPNNSGTSAQDLSVAVNKANSWGADFFASIHLNAGGGQGSEVLYKSVKGKEFADKIVAKLVNLGFTNRGSKVDVRGLYEFNHTNMPNNIVEVFFCDSQLDVNLYNKLGVDVIAKAIAEGIIGHSIENPIPNPIPQPQPSTNNDVKSLQHNLNRLFNAGLVEDGINGANTTAKINQFGAILGVTDINGLLQATNQILTFPLCQVGSKGYGVKYIQYRLGITPLDGDFGNGTKSMVITYQKSKSLVADGIFGNNSWNKLMQ